MKSQEDELVAYEVGKPYPKRLPGGLYDKQIMCAAADNSLGIYDQYAVDFFKWDVDLPLYVDTPGRQAYRVPSFDFDKLNLFLLSYFWRCHHARIAPMKTFSVGDHFAEQIRTKILAHDGREVSWFDFVCFRFENARDLMPYKAPWSARSYDRNILFAYILNWKVMAKLDSRSTPDWLKPFVATRGRELIVRCDEYAGSAEFRNDLSTFREIDRHLK